MNFFVLFCIPSINKKACFIAFCLQLIAMSINFSRGIVDVGKFRFPCAVSAFNNLRRNFEEAENLSYWISVAIKQDRDDGKLSHSRINTVNHLDGVLSLTGTNVLFKLPCSAEYYEKLTGIFDGLAARSAPWHEFAFVIYQWSINFEKSLFKLKLTDSDALNRFLCIYAQHQFESVIAIDKQDSDATLYMIADKDHTKAFRAKSVVDVQVCDEDSVAISHSNDCKIVYLQNADENTKKVILQNRAPSKKQFAQHAPGKLLDLRNKNELLFALLVADTISVNNGHVWWM